MRRTLVLCTLAVLIAFGTVAAAQKSPPSFLARVFLIDQNVNMKEISGLTLILTPINGAPGNPVTLKTAPDGTVEATVPPGNYRLTTPQGTEFNGKKYSWQMDIVVGNIETAVELSNENATIGAL